MVDSVKFVAGGTVQAGGGVYIPRQADQELLALCRSGAFAYVLTPRQMGKSSLMVQTVNVLREQGIRPVTLDLTTIGTQLDTESWYLGLLTIICRQLGLLQRLMKWWQAHRHLGITQRFTQFIEEVILTEVLERIVIFVDEIDTTLNLDFTDDFFIAIRAFYLARAENSEFDRLSFVLFGVATPSDLISNPHRTPFNIGQRVDLIDFTFREALPLADGFGLPSEEAQQLLRWILAWTGGHPYLTQRLCQELRKENHKNWSEVAVAEVVSQIFFGDASKQDTNLQFVRDMLTRRSPDTVGGLTMYCEVLLNKQKVLDEEQSLVKSHLKLSGVVKRQSDGVLQIRNPIYRKVFDRAWVREHLPINWLKRFRRAAITAGIIFLVLLAPLGIFAEIQRQKAVRRGEDLERRTEDLERALNAVKAAHKDAEQARQDQAKLLQIAEERREQAEAAQKAEVKQREEAERERKRAEKAKKQEEIARRAEEKERITAERQKEKAENLAVIARLREKSTRALNYLPTARAAEGLILAMHATIKSRELPPYINPDIASDVISTVESSMLRASEEVKEQMVFRGHEGEVLSAAFSPDDQMIVSGGVDNTVRLWNLQGNQIGEPLDHNSEVVAVAFSSDGQKITAVGRKGVVKQWSISGKPIDSFEATTSFNIISASFSEDGQIIAVTLADGSVAVKNISGSIWREWLANKHLIREFGASLDEEDEVIESSYRPQDSYSFKGRKGQEIVISIESEEFSPSLILESQAGETIIKGDSSLTRILPEDGNYKIIATHRGDKVVSGTHSLQINERKYIEPPILQETAASLEEGDETLELQDAEGQNLSKAPSFFRTVLPETGIYQIVVSASSRESGAYKIVVNPNPTKSISVSSDSQRLATATPEGKIQLWDLQGNLIETSSEGHQGEVLAVAFSSDGQRIVTGGRDRALRLWDLEENQISKPFQGHNGEVLSVAFSSDGQRIVSGGQDGTLRLWDLNGNPLGKPLRGHGSEVLSLTFSADNQRIISSSRDRTLRLWNSDKNISFKGHEKDALFVDFSPDGQSIVSSSQDKTLRLWDLQGNQIGSPFRGHEDSVIGVAFSPDGQRIVSGSYDKTLRLWDLQGNQIGSPFRGHEDSVIGVAFSPDGQRIVSGGADRTIRLWDLQGNQISPPFLGHEDMVVIVVFSPDGQRIVSSSMDGTIRLWDLQGNQIGPSFQGHENGVFGVAFSPDGRRIASASWDGTVRLWGVSWEEWLQNSCKRLQYHPILRKPDESLGEDFRNIASEVRISCDQRIWEKY